MNVGHVILDDALDYYRIEMVNYPDPVDWVEQELGVPWETFRTFATNQFERAVVTGLDPASLFGMAFMWGWSARKAAEGQG